MRITKITLLLLFLTFISIFSQNPLHEKYKLAQSFEKAGDFSSAEKIYLELYNFDKRNKDYFDGIVRTKKAQNKFSELLLLIQEQIQYQNTSELQILLAETLWKLNKPIEAKVAWERGIEIKPNEEETYLTVALSQSSVQQFDLAIATLLQAKKIFPKSSNISEELIKLYFITGKYVVAVDEIFSQFENTRNLNSTQAKIGLLINNNEAVSAIEKKITSSKFSDQRDFKLLAIWFYRSTKNYIKAFEIVKELDKIQKSNGYEVLNFANSSLSDGQYDIAIKGFEYIISLGKKTPYFINAIYGIAKANDAKITEQEISDRISILNIIEQYKEIIHDYPDNQMSFEIKYRIAVLLLKYIRDYPQAEGYLQSLTKAKNHPFFIKSQILLGDISLYKYDFNSAIAMYKLALDLALRDRRDDYYIAMNHLAKAFYYKTEFDSAQYYFSKLLEDGPPEMSSSALRKSIFIEQNKQFTFALANIALAEMKLELNEIDSALNYLRLAKTKSEGTELGEYVSLEIAKLYFMKKEYTTALDVLKKYTQNYPESLYIEEAIYFLGLTYQSLHQRTEAIATFTELLTKYPRSIYSTKARYLINSLQKK